MVPTFAGVITRRLLINFRLDPEVAQRQLPRGVELKLHRGYAVAGLCLIRLDRMHPRFIPLQVGLSSENAAHRYAVRFDGTDGVYIPRRDTNSRLNHLLGGRIVPGEHHAAQFFVEDQGGRVGLTMNSDDGEADIQVAGTEGIELPSSSIFSSLEESSAFFESGGTGISANSRSSALDQIELDVSGWKVTPFDVESVHSSYFDDVDRFPEGSVVFDHALIMRNIPHEWHTRAPFRSASAL